MSFIKVNGTTFTMSDKTFADVCEGARLAEDAKPRCSYCPSPAQDGPLCGFHSDWECACNIVEDMCGGSTPGSMVVAWMIEHGWTQKTIDHMLGTEYDREAV